MSPAGTLRGRARRGEGRTARRARLAHAPARPRRHRPAPRPIAHLDRAATRQLDDADLDHRLRELVRIRASQLNGCAYCVDMHSKDARAIGETEQRLYALPVWRETPSFSSRERAALSFTETVTRLAETHVPDEAYEEVAAAFSPAEVGALLGLIVTINAWNALSVASRAWEPGS